VEDEMAEYERELDTLCTFQQCYGKCHEEIMGRWGQIRQILLRKFSLFSLTFWH
jgi:hypothetical protein